MRTLAAHIQYRQRNLVKAETAHWNFVLEMLGPCLVDERLLILWLDLKTGRYSGRKETRNHAFEIPTDTTLTRTRPHPRLNRKPKPSFIHLPPLPPAELIYDVSALFQMA